MLSFTVTFPKVEGSLRCGDRVYEDAKDYGNTTFSEKGPVNAGTSHKCPINNLLPRRPYHEGATMEIEMMKVGEES